MTSSKNGERDQDEVQGDFESTSVESSTETLPVDSLRATRPEDGDSFDCTLLAADMDQTIAQSEYSSSVRDVLPGPIQLGRYLCDRELGRGGMGRVLQGRDIELRRQVAVKVVLDPSKFSQTQIKRFIAEAQITSQMQHPSIVPVYDIGTTDEGTVYYVMKKVEGRTLKDILEALRQGDEETRQQWTRHRLLNAFVLVCEAMAYAHEMGVLHRDLKPENIMLGRFGEVLILDWGVARLMGDETESLTSQSIDRVSMAATSDGVVIGTAGHMSPEQASGRLSELDGRSDVWSLGTILYEILTYQPAFTGTNIFSLMYKVLNESPENPQERSPQLGIPDEIAEVCMQALATNREDRTSSAQELVASVRDFLEGARRRERALELVAESEALAVEVSSLRTRVVSLRDKAGNLLEEVKPYEPAKKKLPAWNLEDEATRLESKAIQLEVEYQQKLNAAFVFVPDLPEAHRLLASKYRDLHARAESSRDDQERTRYETLLRYHERGEHASYLLGRGAVTLFTDPPGAEVDLFRYEIHERRLVARPVRALGRSPLEAVELEMGSYLLKLRASGRTEVLYPVSIDRQEHWDGIAPGETEPHPVYLPKEEELTSGEVYIPAGWFWSGGDDDASQSLPRRRLWADGLVICKYPVTNRTYIQFLDDLVSRGREEEALRHAPRERAGTVGEEGALIYGRDQRGRFVLRADADGDRWHPDWPVVMVDWYGASAYCEWLAQLTGVSWRLPYELEWEKAARGVDGRFFPWGDNLDPSWCCMRDSHAGPMLPAKVMSYPLDESPYGVRGMGGNVIDWCRDAHHVEGPPLAGARIGWAYGQWEFDAGDNRVGRGGCWFSDARNARIESRNRARATSRNHDVGFRPLRSFPTQ